MVGASKQLSYHSPPLTSFFVKTACKQVRQGAGTNIAFHVAFPLQRKQRSVCCNASLYSSICVFVSSKCSDAVKKWGGDTSPWIRECAGESGSKRGGFTRPGNGRFKVCRTCVTYRLSGESAHCRVSVAQWWSIGEQNSMVWGSILHGDSNFTPSQVRDKTERHMSFCQYLGHDTLGTVFVTVMFTALRISSNICIYIIVSCCSDSGGLSRSSSIQSETSIPAPPGPPVKLRELPHLR